MQCNCNGGLEVNREKSVGGDVMMVRRGVMVDVCGWKGMFSDFLRRVVLSVAIFEIVTSRVLNTPSFQWLGVRGRSVSSRLRLGDQGRFLIWNFQNTLGSRVQG